MVKVIDSHVHDRGWEESDKETPAHALEVARDSGVSMIAVMPNTKPPILEEEQVVQRLKEADEANVREVTYSVWMGLSANKEQVRRAVGTYRKFFPRVIGFKMYAGHSVGRPGVIKIDEQFGVDVCSVLPIQAVFYSSMLVVSGASKEEIAVALPTGLAIGLGLTEPFGRWMDIWRKMWGKKPAIKTNENT